MKISPIPIIAVRTATRVTHWAGIGPRLCGWTAFGKYLGAWYPER